MEILIPKESEKFPGYYCVPGNDLVVASPDGRFINLLTGNPATPGQLETGYWKISINRYSRGEKTANFYVHRLLARTFVGRPKRHLEKDFEHLEVNHIDGNKSNNALDNLEWITPSENSKHALASRLTQHTAVIARHILNGALIDFPTISECARHFDLNIKRLTRHLKSKSAGTLTKNWFVFKFDDGASWPKLSNKHHQENGWSVRFGIWYAKSVEIEQTVIANTLEQLCGLVGLSYPAVQTHLRDQGADKPYGGWLWIYDENPMEDVVKMLPGRKVPEGIKSPTVLRFTSPSGEVMEFESIRKAAKFFNTRENNLIYALDKRKGVFREYSVERA